MVIARQSGLLSEGASTRPTSGLPRVPHPVVAVDEPRRVRTLAKIVGLIAITAVSVPLCAALVAGGTFFAIMTLR